MRRLALALLALIPATPALAGIECGVERQCGGGTCEPFTGDPFLIEETGDVWRISWQGQVWEGYQTSTVDNEDELSIVIPPQNGVSGLVSIYASGAFLFTAHALGDGAVAITGSGACQAHGG